MRREERRRKKKKKQEGLVVGEKSNIFWPARPKTRSQEPIHASKMGSIDQVDSITCWLSRYILPEYWITYGVAGTWTRHTDVRCWCLNCYVTCPLLTLPLRVFPETPDTEQEATTKILCEAHFTLIKFPLIKECHRAIQGRPQAPRPTRVLQVSWTSVCPS